MKIIYEDCGVKNYMKEDDRSYRHNPCSCEKKAWKNKIKSGLYGIQAWNGNPVQAWIFFQIFFLQLQKPRLQLQWSSFT